MIHSAVLMMTLCFKMRRSPWGNQHHDGLATASQCWLRSDLCAGKPRSQNLGVGIPGSQSYRYHSRDGSPCPGLHLSHDLLEDLSRLYHAGPWFCQKHSVVPSEQWHDLQSRSFPSSATGHSNPKQKHQSDAVSGTCQSELRIDPLYESSFDPPPAVS